MTFRHLQNIFLTLLSLFFITVGYLVLFYTFTALPATEIDTISSKQSIIVVDRNDEFLFDFSEDEKRLFTPINEVSPHIINATIAIEDDLFFQHKGIRPEAFARAVWNNIKSGSFSQGGSTITQQVIKNIFLTSEKKVTRKIKEMFLALKLEERLSKEEILEIYLNTIPYGGVSYGVAEASSAFFGKDPNEATIAEAAYLAAIPNAPTFYSPYGSNKKLLEERKNRVLGLMLDQGRITRDEYETAKRENVHFQSRDVFSIKAPHFVFFVKEILEREYGPSMKPLEGKEIRTTLDLAMQQEIEEQIQAFAPALEEKHGADNIAALVLLANTGEILTMIGSRDFFDSDIDGSVNLTTSLRQPGSTFKPIVYAQAFEKGLRPETVVYDVQTQFSESCDEDLFETTSDGCYSPFNYTGRFSGPVSLRNALASSVNIPAVKALYLAGIPETISLAKKMGITSITEQPEHYGLSLALGSTDITPLELAQAYNVFANEGIFVPYTWKKESMQPTIRKRILSTSVVRDITDILSDDNARSQTFGRHSPLNIDDGSVAVKTGTTNNSRDIWIVGYSPNIVALIWAGNSDNGVLENNAVGFSLAPLFRDVITTAINTYGKRYTSFTPNIPVTSPDTPDIVRGFIDHDEQHAILHYISKDNPTKPTEDPEQDPQYENWEFGVQDWLNESDIGKYENVTVNERIFYIETPKQRNTLSATQPTLVRANAIGLDNPTYEIYYNDTFYAEKDGDPIFFFEPKDVDPGDREVTIQIIAITDDGIYLAEETYDIERVFDR
ncbi:MAG: transglycosylase domain-containing protein [Candidatus Kaiserbacteria bacterium]|nr:transglycosylase domain-containing protein [Candidatus Kaiserbacteria bacterium]